MITKILATRADGSDITCDFLDENDFNEYISTVSRDTLIALFTNCTLSQIKKMYNAYMKCGVK